MARNIGIGFGVSLGAGMAYLLATDQVFRLVILILLAVILLVGFILVIMLMVSRIQMSTMRAMGEAVRPSAVNYNSRFPPSPVFYPQQAQLPPSYQFGYGPTAVEPVITVNDQRGEVMDE